MKMIYGSLKCDMSVASNFYFSASKNCEYERDTIRYAVERFFVKSEKFCKVCAYESWQVRLAKSKKDKKRPFSYVIPAVLMELPGEWVRVSGDMDAVGVNVRKVELLEEHPCFDEEENSSQKGKRNYNNAKGDSYGKRKVND